MDKNCKMLIKIKRSITYEIQTMLCPTNIMLN